MIFDSSSSVPVNGIWNFYNQVEDDFYRTESTSSWTLTSTSWVSANASLSNRINLVNGIAGTSDASLFVLASSAAGAELLLENLRLNGSTTVCKSGQMYYNTANLVQPVVGDGRAVLSTPGLNYLQWQEYLNTAGTVTVYGSGYSYIKARMKW